MRAGVQSVGKESEGERGRDWFVQSGCGEEKGAHLLFCLQAPAMCRGRGWPRAPHRGDKKGGLCEVCSA